VAAFRDMSTTCRRPADVSDGQPLLTMELGVGGIGYDEAVLSVGDCGGGGDEQEEDDDDDDEEDAEEDEDDVSVLSVNGTDGERVAAAAAEAPAVADPTGWMELSLWPRWVMRLAPRVTSRPGVAARHRDTSDAQRV